MTEDQIPTLTSVPVLRRLWVVVALTVTIILFWLALIMLLSGPIYRWRDGGWRPIGKGARLTYAGFLGLWLLAAIAHTAFQPGGLKQEWANSASPDSATATASTDKAANTDGLVTCDSEEAIESVKAALEDQASKLVSVKVQDFGKAQETFYEKDRHLRRCAAQAVLNTGPTLVTYQLFLGPSGKPLVQAQVGDDATTQYEVDKAKKEEADRLAASQPHTQSVDVGPAKQTADPQAAVAPTQPAPAGNGVKSADDKYSATYQKCMNTGDAAQGVTAAMSECLSSELTFQDGRLNTAYKATMANLSPAKQSNLRAAQRQWIKYRDSKCDAENQSGGTMDGPGRLSCHLEMTVTRAEELQKMGGE